MGFKKFLFKNIGFFLVFAVCILYILKGLFQIGETGANAGEILGNSALSMAVGFAINVIFRQNGIIYAEDDPEVIAVNNLHLKTVDEITPNIDLLDEFCNMENARIMKELRTKILGEYGLKYDTCFNCDGVSKDYLPVFEKGMTKEQVKREKAKYKAYKKAVKLKITYLTPSTLTTDDADGDDPFDFGISKGKYQRKKSTLDLLTRPIFGILFGYYTLKKLDCFHVEDIIWNALQIIIFLIFGAIQMFESYMFIKGENTSKILKKTDKLQKFKIYSDSANKKQEQ